MRITESKVCYEISAILSDNEAERFYEAFRAGTPVLIPELGWTLFDVRKINVCLENQKHIYLIALEQHGFDRLDPESGKRIL